MSPQSDRSPQAPVGLAPAAVVRLRPFQHLSPVLRQTAILQGSIDRLLATGQQQDEVLRGSTDCHLVTRQSDQSHLDLRHQPPGLPLIQRAQARPRLTVTFGWNGLPPRRLHFVVLLGFGCQALRPLISPSPAGGLGSRSIWSIPGRGIGHCGRGILETDCCGRSRRPRTSRRNSRVTTFMLVGPSPGVVCYSRGWSRGRVEGGLDVLA